jgi:hypothetical protein
MIATHANVTKKMKKVTLQKAIFHQRRGGLRVCVKENVFCSNIGWGGSFQSLDGFQLDLRARRSAQQLAVIKQARQWSGDLHIEILLPTYIEVMLGSSRNEVSPSVADALIRLFLQMYSQKRRLIITSHPRPVQMETYNHPRDPLPIGSRLQSAFNAANSLCILWSLETGNPLLLSSTVIWGLKVNPTLQELHINSFDKQSATRLGEALITVTTLRKLSLARCDSGISMGGVLYRGLEANRSLTELHLHAFHRPKVATILLRAIQNHPTISKLRLSYIRSLNEALPSLSNLLCMKNCKLSELTLTHGYSAVDSSIPIDILGGSLDLETLIPGLTRNRSLESLELSGMNLSTSDADLLLSVAWRCPRLTALDLRYNKIQSLELRKLRSQPKMCHLRRLYLGGNPVLQYRWSPHGKGSRENFHAKYRWLFEILKACPELYEFGPLSDFRVKQFWTTFVAHPVVQHVVDLNRFGRVLLTDYDLPLSIWPICLARANRNLGDCPRRRADVVFHLIHDGSAALLANQTR